MEAVSEVMGTILLVAITVAMVVALSYLVMSRAGPLDTVNSDFSFLVDSGADGQWSTADERLFLEHRGGEDLRQAETTITISIDGVPTVYSDATLGSAFSPEGRFNVGEIWSTTGDIPLDAQVTLAITSLSGGGSQIVFTSSLVAACQGDLTPPVESIHTQSPADVTTATTGAGAVVFTLDDECSGVDNAFNPSLFYRVNPGASPPAYTNGGAMTWTAANTWSRTIPDPTWSAQGGKTLEYYVDSMRDAALNLGRSAVAKDAIGSGGSFNYASSSNPIIGSIAAFANAQSAADGGLEATLSESPTLAPLTLRLAARDVSTLGAGWNVLNHAGASDNDYQTNALTGAGTVKYDLYDDALFPGTITSVLLKAEVSISSYVDDAFQIRGCLGSLCDLYSSNVGGSAADVIVSYEISCKRPGSPDGSCGLWDWVDVNALLYEVKPVQNGAGRDGTWRVDHAYVEVSYTPHAGERMAIEFSFAGVPAGASHVLEVRYRSATDAFLLEAWDGFSWNPHGPLLTQTSASLVQVSLSTAEFQSGSPKIRFLDANTAVAAGTLYIDYARVKTV